ncbi:MAG TPA: hypothetical protein VIF64_00305 [Pyrinomonadaceae bacterium]|jgi:predicted nuclease with TOPRIM domain
MTQEARLDRLERIAKLFVRAGLRARAEVRDHDNKINHLINLQIRNEELFKQNEERFSRLEESQAHLATSQASLAESQVRSDARLNALIEVIREGRGADTERNN